MSHCEVEVWTCSESFCNNKILPYFVLFGVLYVPSFHLLCFELRLFLGCIFSLLHVPRSVDFLPDSGWKSLRTPTCCSLLGHPNLFRSTLGQIVSTSENDQRVSYPLCSPSMVHYRRWRLHRHTSSTYNIERQNRRFFVCIVCLYCLSVLSVCIICL